jgi:hypothetical protein
LTLLNNEEFIEKAQELLDGGYSPNKTAETLGIYHAKVTRLIQKGKLETYKPFDEHTVENFPDNLEWLSEEDWLECLCREAYDDVAYLRKSENVETLRVGKYVRDKYGTLKAYLKLKGLTQLQEYIQIWCNSCEEFTSLQGWYENSIRVWGLIHECPKCRREISSRYNYNNPTKIFLLAQKRRAMASLLPGQFSKDEWTKVRSDYRWRCAITNQQNNISIDHFIPVITGQGGTYYGNLIPLRKEINSSKRERNPFDWAKEKDYKIELVTLYLAEQNALTKSEYAEFVNWCFDNKRNVDEVIADQRYSIEIWREATGRHFPVPKYVLNEIGNHSTDAKTTAIVEVKEAQ